MLALLSVIAGSMAFSSRTEVLIVGNLSGLAQAEALADAGVYKAIHELVTRPSTDLQRWQGNGQPHRWTFGDATLKVTLLDESGKIDLNMAPEPLLRGLFVSQGVAEEDAIALIDAMLDWRDSDDLRRMHGAESQDYAAAGKNYGPANADFESIEEFHQVLGMNEQLYQRIETLITVFSGQPGVNSVVAPRQTLLALPGATAELIDPYLDQRRTALELGAPVPPFPLTQAFGANATNAVFTIQVEAVLGDNTRFFREAVVRLTGNIKEPVTMLAWRAPMVAMSPLTNSSNTPYHD